MKFKIDENLKFVAREKGVTPEILSNELCARLVESTMIEDGEENYGLPVMMVSGPEYVSDICAAFAGYLYGDPAHSIPCDIFNALCDLVLIGDGDCPECGCYMDLYDSGTHEIPSGNYDVPPEIVTDWEIWRCPNCGIEIDKVF